MLVISPAYSASQRTTFGEASKPTTASTAKKAAAEDVERMYLDAANRRQQHRQQGHAHGEQTPTSKRPEDEITDSSTHGASPENGDFRKPSMTLPALPRFGTRRPYWW